MYIYIYIYIYIKSHPPVSDDVLGPYPVSPRGVRTAVFLSSRNVKSRAWTNLKLIGGPRGLKHDLELLSFEIETLES